MSLIIIFLPFNTFLQEKHFVRLRKYRTRHTFLYQPKTRSQQYQSWRYKTNRWPPTLPSSWHFLLKPLFRIQWIRNQLAFCTYLSYYFIKDSKKFQKKVKYFIKIIIYYRFLFDNIYFSMVTKMSKYTVESWSIFHDKRSADLDPKEIFRDP